METVLTILCHLYSPVLNPRQKGSHQLDVQMWNDKNFVNTAITRGRLNRTEKSGEKWGRAGRQEIVL